MARKKSKITAAAASAHDAGEDEDSNEREQLHDAICRIPVLAPWTEYVAFEPSFSDEMNQDLALRVRDLVFEELERCFLRLKKHQQESDATGLITKRATRTLLENRLAVEASRRIDLQQITQNMKSAMKAANAMLNSPGGLIVRRGSGQGKAWGGTTSHDQGAEKAGGFGHNGGLPVLSAANRQKLQQLRRRSSGREQAEEKPQYRGPLFIEFPPSPPKLSDLVDQAEAELTDDDRDNQVTNFRQRPVLGSAVEDAGSPVSRREAKPDRVRYIMSTRLGALPPTKNILEEYPIPKEILEALETHRHYHIDESSLMSSFDSMQAGTSGDWECYFRRSVPVERKPISFVLSSLEIANERPVPPPSDIFQHHLLESATNDDIMLTEVRQLYDHTHESYRDFRASLHRHLDLQYLVDLSLRSSLNTTTYFLEEELVSSEPTVQIPERLYRRTNNSLAAKWRIASKGAMGAMGRMNTRRGAIALQIKVELSKAQRNELLNKICHFTPNEIQLMDLWYSYDADAGDATPFDPIPMMPELSHRFDVVWKDLSMPAKERLDLAIKYSSLENSSRLPDAVLLWEVAAALVREREELLRLARLALAMPKRTTAMIAEEIAMLQDLALTTTHVKEALLLTYIEVGDFITLAGNFYLVKMEHEASELEQAIVESMEAAKRKPGAEGEGMSELSPAKLAGFVAAAVGANPSSDRESAHRDTWV